MFHVNVMRELETAQLIRFKGIQIPSKGNWNLKARVDQSSAKFWPLVTQILFPENK